MRKDEFVQASLTGEHERRILPKAANQLNKSRTKAMPSRNRSLVD
ncbi:MULTISPECIES: hypothetical protein [Enterococcus]|uniref:Uncharacterized protein n=1 Tax=Enterococcus casseliflavus TaxID=37734 RepID=A0ABD5FNI4_ENTCA|nr:MULTISPECIES: hypothetical protein [Enterococcus]MDT2983786.1 hypothetical protein [Enterococcus casseliflavus]